MILLSSTIGRDLASGDVIGRGAGTLLHGLSDHLQPREKPVVDLRDEDKDEDEA